MDEFWSVLENYCNLTDESKNLLKKLMKEKKLLKNEIYLHEGDIPKNVAFIKKGLLSYYYCDQTGNKVIKRFFSENDFVASTSALISKSPSVFTIQALEDTLVYQFNFNNFIELVNSNHDIASLYIKYVEENWIINKELQEITSKQKTAKQRYLDFLKSDAHLVSRLKQHHIASFLAITPTQLSRIRADIQQFHQHM